MGPAANSRRIAPEVHQRSPWFTRFVRMDTILAFEGSIISRSATTQDAQRDTASSNLAWQGHNHLGAAQDPPDAVLGRAQPQLRRVPLQLEGEVVGCQSPNGAMKAEQWSVPRAAFQRTHVASERGPAHSDANVR